MNAKEIIREIMTREGISGVSLSARLGASRNYIGQKLVQQKIHVDTFANICDALDHDVIVRNRSDGAEYFLSPPDE